MKTTEIINNVCSHLGIAKADLAKMIGVYPSSLYRKLANESMTLEELQKCLDVLGVSMELVIKYQDGNNITSKENHEKILDRMDLLKKELEVANQNAEFCKKSLRDLRTELNSAVGFTELIARNKTKSEEYLGKLNMIQTNMGRTIAYALGEGLEEEFDLDEYDDVEELDGKRVLVVEDNELNRNMMKEILVDHGLIVEEAENGRNAFLAIRNNIPGYYNFVLMDIEMPEMDGYDATMKIRKLPNRIRANVPIIALTANAVTENRERASAVGMDGFLVKPISSARLLRILSKFL
ncbi:MAG: response regulator [Agathobacter sp.]|nr:response regulator [Agathobacter sp.]